MYTLFFGEKFRLTQLGFITPRGAEAIGHSARKCLEQNADPYSKILLKNDFKTSFNSILFVPQL